MEKGLATEPRIAYDAELHTMYVELGAPLTVMVKAGNQLTGIVKTYMLRVNDRGVVLV